MTLAIYEGTSGSDLPFSTGAMFTNAFTATFDGRVGGTEDFLLYLRNSNVLYTYSDITIQAYQSEGSIDLVEGTQGFSFKMKAGDAEPTSEEWASIQAGNTISLSDLEDIITYLPFWVRIEVPRQVPVQRFRGVSFKIIATQNLVE